VKGGRPRAFLRQQRTEKKGVSDLVERMKKGGKGGENVVGRGKTRSSKRERGDQKFWGGKVSRSLGTNRRRREKRQGGKGGKENTEKNWDGGDSLSTGGKRKNLGGEGEFAWWGGALTTEQETQGKT